MVRITRDNDVSSLERSSFSKMLHASNERAGRVDYFGCPAFQFTLHVRRYAMRANHCNRVGVCFLRRVDGRYAARAEPLHLLRVVNQWSKRTNRAHALFDNLFHHFDSTLNAETESVFVCD